MNSSGLFSYTLIIFLLPQDLFSPIHKVQAMQHYSYKKCLTFDL